MSLLCIYHANCADGFTAAWAVWRASPDAEFHPGFYGYPPPDCTGRDVVLVDFSYKRDVLVQIAEVANSILILDHHKSAQTELVNLPDNVTAIFDMNQSGAMLTWNYYHPEQEPSKLVHHVQDRDLWRFDDKNTRYFQANLFSYEYEFELWDKIDALCRNENEYNAFIRDGQAIHRKHMKDVKELIRSTATRTVIAGYDVPIINVPYIYASDACHHMSQGEPFAACYWDTANARTYSLRSADDGVDVAVIAEQFGGGGHKHAAGFRLGFDELGRLEEVMEKGKAKP